MTIPPAALLGAAILSEVMATTALKASDGFTRLGPSLLAGPGDEKYPHRRGLRRVVGPGHRVDFGGGLGGVRRKTGHRRFDWYGDDCGGGGRHPAVFEDGGALTAPKKPPPFESALNRPLAPCEWTLTAIYLIANNLSGPAQPHPAAAPDAGARAANSPPWLAGRCRYKRR